MTEKCKKPKRKEKGKERNGRCGKLRMLFRAADTSGTPLPDRRGWVEEGGWFRPEIYNALAIGRC